MSEIGEINMTQPDMILVGEAKFPPHVPKLIKGQVTDKAVDMDPIQMVENMDRTDAEMVSAAMRVGSYVSDFAARLLMGIDPKDIHLNTKFVDTIVSDWRSGMDLGGHNWEDFWKPKIKDCLLANMQKMAQKFASNMKKESPGSTRFFLASYETSNEQEKRLSIIDDDEVSQTLLNLLQTITVEGEPVYRNLDELAYKVVTDRNFGLPVSWLKDIFEFDQNMLSEKVGVSKIIEMMELPKYKGLLNQNLPKHKLMQFIVDVSTYRTINLNVADITPEVLANILPEYRNITAIAGVRPDIMGLYPVAPKDDDAIKAIDNYINLASGSRFGNRPLLDTQGMSGQDREAVIKLLDLIRQKRVGWVMGEFKLNVMLRESDFGKIDRRPAPGQINRFRRGLGFRAWGVFQQVMASYIQNPESFQSTEFQDFMDAASVLVSEGTNGQKKSSLERFSRLKTIAPDLRKFLNPFIAPHNKAFLTVGSLPLFGITINPSNSKKEMVPKFLVKWKIKKDKKGLISLDKRTYLDLEYPPVITAKIKLKSNELYRLARRAGRTIARKLSNIHELKRFIKQKKESENQDPGPETIIGPIIEVN